MGGGCCSPKKETIIEGITTIEQQEAQLHTEYHAENQLQRKASSESIDRYRNAMQKSKKNQKEEEFTHSSGSKKQPRSTRSLNRNVFLEDSFEKRSPGQVPLGFFEEDNPSFEIQVIHFTSDGYDDKEIEEDQENSYTDESLRQERKSIRSPRLTVEDINQKGSLDTERKIEELIENKQINQRIDKRSDDLEETNMDQHPFHKSHRFHLTQQNEKEISDQTQVERVNNNISSVKQAHQIDYLNQAMQNCEKLQSIGTYGGKLTKALGEVNSMIQILCESSFNPKYLRALKQNLILLYSRMHRFQSFDLRFTYEDDFINVSATAEALHIMRFIYANSTSEWEMSKHLEFTQALEEPGEIHDKFNDAMTRLLQISEDFEIIRQKSIQLYGTANNNGVVQSLSKKEQQLELNGDSIHGALPDLTVNRFQSTQQNKDNLIKYKDNTATTTTTTTSHKIKEMQSEIECQQNSPNYIFKTLHGQPGFTIWEMLFSESVEASIDGFAERFASVFGIKKLPILRLMKLLNAAKKDNRIDVYSWVRIVNKYHNFFFRRNDDDNQDNNNNQNERIIFIINRENISRLTNLIEIDMKDDLMNSTPIKREDGKYQLPLGSIYTGFIDELNRKQGLGSIVGDRFEFRGTFVDDLPEGQGYEMRRFVEYSGFFKEGMYEGEGVLKFPNGRVYKGMFLNHKFHGIGELLREDGVTFSGEWRMNQLSFGTITYQDGSQYIGQIKNSFYKHGLGSLRIVSNARGYNQAEKALINSQIIQINESARGILESTHLDVREPRNTQETVGVATSQIQPTTNVIQLLEESLSKESMVPGGEKKKKNVLAFEGTWKDDEPFYGKMYTQEEILMYDGPFADWAITGKGKRCYVDGNYEGEMTSDSKEGVGTMTYLNGHSFAGKWVGDVQSVGVYYFGIDSKNKYEGDWVNGIMEGKGILTYETGGKYEGEVKDGKRHGNGKYEYRNGNKYTGSWVENEQNGEGLFEYTLDSNNKGDFYYGQFLKGKFHGFGHYVYASSGRQYLGYWENDKWYGEGRFMDKNGKILKAGLWKEDQLVFEMSDDEIVIPQHLQHLVWEP